MYNHLNHQQDALYLANKETLQQIHNQSQMNQHINEQNNRLQQEILDEELKNQKFEERLAKERAKTAEIAAENQSLEGDKEGSDTEVKTQKRFGNFGDKWKEDPLEKFQKFDGSNFMNPNKKKNEPARKGWGENELKLEIKSRDPLVNQFAPTDNENQNNTGHDMATTEMINNRMYGAAKERAKKWTVGYGTRFS